MTGNVYRVYVKLWSGVNIWKTRCRFYLLNPIFESDNHGYDTRDFKTIDCRLGRNEDFADVCQDLHNHNVKIVLDGVFNHVGRGFEPFRDLQEKEKLPYIKTGSAMCILAAVHRWVMHFPMIHGRATGS